MKSLKKISWVGWKHFAGGGRFFFESELLKHLKASKQVLEIWRNVWIWKVSLMLLKKYWLARKIQFEVGSEYLRDNIGAGCVLLPLSICGTSLLANFSQKEHFSRHQLCMYATLSITLATFGDRIKIGIILMFGTCGQDKTRQDKIYFG